ncbi:MAG: transcriptional regulator NrdR [Victivallales bacterium]|jgi:transcriptional repressor NrdR|nr:transcriptional regulator NrdR [Victivallales bacterium]
MRCPKCGCLDDKVIDSRAVKEGAGVRRRRECLSCSYRYTTIEGIVPEELKVVKRNSEREDFDRDKLRRGIANACYKRPINPDDIDRAVEDISAAILCEYDKEVASADIGSRVMSELRKIDQVAYVRFASVYRKFKDVEEFIDEIRALK